MLRSVFGVLFVAALAGLAGVDLVSFRRTRPLRRGERSRSLPTRGAERSSRTTHLPWAAGLLIVGLGLAQARDGPRGPPNTVATAVLVAAGSFVAVTGWWARVTGVTVDGSGFTIRYRRSRDFSLRWDECLALRPPRSPPAGWRVMGEGGSRTLMPSDLLGNEGFLEVLVERASLTFDGRAWR